MREVGAIDWIAYGRLVIALTNMHNEKLGLPPC
jgi:hypothetical protein